MTVNLTSNPSARRNLFGTRENDLQDRPAVLEDPANHTSSPQNSSSLIGRVVAWQSGSYQILERISLSNGERGPGSPSSPFRSEE